MVRRANAWKARRTLLIVGEGGDEEAFLGHVKQLYVPRGCGLTVSIKNAHGKGARHVVTWTARQMTNATYDCVAVLLDIDTDWSPKVAACAKRKGTAVLQSDPCFEAMMLRLLGQTPVHSAKALKKRFSPYVGHDATQRDHYQTHFGACCLEAGRTREPTREHALSQLAMYSEGMSLLARQNNAARNSCGRLARPKKRPHGSYET